MRKSGRDARNAETDTPSVENTHDLRMTALLSISSKRGAGEAPRRFWA